MDGVGSPVCVRAVGWGTRGCIVPRFVDKEIVEEEAEVDAVLLQELLALHMGDLDRVFDRARLDIGAVHLFAKHLGV